MCRDPSQTKKAWLEKLAEVDRKRSTLIDLAADETILRDEFRTKLAGVYETRATASHELDTLDWHQGRMEGWEKDRDTLLESYAGMIPEALDNVPEERHHAYKVLRLRCVLASDAPPPRLTGVITGDLEVHKSEAGC